MAAHPRVDWWSNGTDAAAELRAHAGGAARGARALRRERDPPRPADGHARGGAGAALPAPPLPGRGGGLGAGRAALRLRACAATAARRRGRASAAEQKAALEALLRTLDPAELRLPESVLAAIPPRPSGYGPHRELFPRYTGAVFDAVSPAVVAADHTVSQLLDPERAARLVEQKALDPTLPGLDDVLDAAGRAAVEGRDRASPYEAEIARAVERVVAERLMGLAGGARMPQVRALASDALQSARARRPPRRRPDGSRPRTSALLAQDIRRFLERPAAPLALARDSRDPARPADRRAGARLPALARAVLPLGRLALTHRSGVNARPRPDRSASSWRSAITWPRVPWACRRRGAAAPEHRARQAGAANGARLEERAGRDSASRRSSAAADRPARSPSHEGLGVSRSGRSLLRR